MVRHGYHGKPFKWGEAIVFAYPQGVELDEARSLSAGPLALVEKQKSKYRLRDYAERGADDKLGLPDDGAQAALIDVFHRLSYLIENNPAEIARFSTKRSPTSNNCCSWRRLSQAARWVGQVQAAGRRWSRRAARKPRR